MTTQEARLAEPNSAHIGEGVTFKGSISAPDLIVVDGTVEGDVTARSVRVGVTGSIKGTVTSMDADVQGKLCDKIEVKEFLLVRSTGHIEGSLACGDVQVERGAVLSANVTSIRAKAEAARPAETPRAPAERLEGPEPATADAARAEQAKIKLAAAE